LIALVRELEEGAVALSTASPPRRPPPQVWANIDQVLRQENRRGMMLSTFRIGWWRSGWAAAVASVVGWVIYAVFVSVHHVAPTAASRETTAAAAGPEVENIAPKPPVPAASNANVQLLRIRTEEINDLRLKIAQLENETGQLSQLVVQQRTLLAESNRIKFYQLTPAAAAGNEAAAAQFSPALQRAVFMSIGRELGWLTVEPKPRPGIAPAGHTTVKSVDGVDFVDLRPTKNEGANQSPSQPTPPAATSAQQTPVQSETPPSEMAAAAIPAFVSGDKLVVALDPATVLANSTVTFSIPGLTGGTTDGSFVMGNNPVVVTMPCSAGTAYSGGWFFTIGTAPLQGSSNLTQFFVPANP